MSREVDAKRFTRSFVCMFLIMTLCVGIYNYVIDPYFCYRMTDRSKYFSWDQTDSPTWKYGQSKQFRGYNALWVGSSVSSHVDVDYVGQKMGVKCAGSVQASGRPNIYEKFIRNAMKHNELKYVFYELNLTHWCWESIGTEFDIDKYVAGYVRSDSILDDGDYLLNRKITAESSNILAGIIGDGIVGLKNKLGVDDGRSYENVESIMPEGTIYSTANVARNIYANNYTWGFSSEVRDADLQAGMNNIDTYIAPLIEENPETEFIFVIPPTGVSVLSCVNEAGYLDDYLYIMDKIFTRLLSYPNVRLIASDLDYDYNTNMDHYMDSGHYEPSGAVMMIDFIANGENEVKMDNIDETIQRYRYMAETFEWPFLKINFVGDRVTDLQKKLIILGYDINVTGVYDSATENAVKRFQEENGLEVTGTAFSDTLDLIKKLISDDYVE
jgi:hypothetical protein